MWRDPAGQLREMAEHRAKNRLLHPLRGGDPDEEFRSLWSSRWAMPVIAGGYVLGVIGLWVTAIRC